MADIPDHAGSSEGGVGTAKPTKTQAETLDLAREGGLTMRHLVNCDVGELRAFRECEEAGLVAVDGMSHRWLLTDTGRAALEEAIKGA